MSKTRIAVFEGMGRSRRPSRRYGAPLFNNRGPDYGGALFENPRPQGYGFAPRTMPRGMGFDPRTMPQGIGSYGRRPYYVEPLYGASRYGPVTEGGRRASTLKRKGYRVKKGRNTKAQTRFKKVAKKCARVSRGKRKGSYQSCMRKHLKRGRRSRR